MKLALILLALLLPASPLWAAQTFYKSITLEESESGTADSNDFPLTFIGDSFLADTANGGKCVVGNSGYDVRFYADSGLSTPLTFERVFWTNTTGVGEWHVKIPTLSTTTDTVIYVACGDAALTTNGSSTTTWSTTFKGVYHLGDGTTLSANDSTSNVHHGTNNGAVAGAGRVGGAGVFTSDYIDLGTQADFTFGTTEPFTISAWVNGANAADSPQSVVATYDPGVGVGSWTIPLTIGPYKCQPARLAAPFNIFCGTTLSTATWYLVHFTYDGTNMNVYLNGVSDATPVATGTHAPASVKTLIGASLNTAPAVGNYFPGSIDEVRLENTARPLSWLTATYNNQKAASTFTTLGSLTAVTGDVTFSDPRPTWFRYAQEYVDHEIDTYMANTFFTTAQLWPPLTANTITKVGNGTAKDLDVFYPSSGGDPSPCHTFFLAFGQFPCAVAQIEAFQTTMSDLAAARLAATGSSVGVWWNIGPEWDALGGHHIPVSGHPFTAGTRAGMYTQYEDYVNNWTPTWTMLQTAQAVRGFWQFVVNVWNSNVHYSYQWGMDLVMLERGIDNLGDLETGIAFTRGAAAQYNKPWGIETAAFRTSAGDRAVTTYDQGTGLQTGGVSASFIKRHLYLSWMSGANKVSNEPVLIRYGDNSLNPLGTVLSNFGDVTVAHPTRGEAVVPIALMMDHDHGFVPRHWIYHDAPLVARSVWYGIQPYNVGDHAVDALFVNLWPDHWKHGQSLGWNGGSTIVDTDYAAFGSWIAAGNDPRPFEPMPTSTYGDLFDVLLSDATLPALNRYHVIMPVGNFVMTPTLNTMFSDYATAGGTVVLNASQVTSADETLLGVTLGSTTTSTSSKWGAESNLTESTYTYRIVTLGTATTIATNPVTGDPVITRRAVGTGFIYFVTPTYMQDDANTALLEIAKRLLSDLTVTHRKGWAAGSAVDFLTTETETGLIVTVANNTGSTWNGTVNVAIANPTSATEWLTSTSPSYALVNGVTEVTASVPAYDVRIFEVMGDESPPGGAPAAPTGLRFVSLSATDVVLIWTPNTEVNLAGYKVYGGPIPGQPTTLLRTITAASAAASRSPMTVFRDRVTTAGTKYYTVTAFNTVDEEGPAATEINTTVTGMSGRSPRIPTP